MQVAVPLLMGVQRCDESHFIQVAPRLEKLNSSMQALFERLERAESAQIQRDDREVAQAQELRVLREKLAEKEDEARKAHAANDAAFKQRQEQAQARAMRRMFNQELARGFNAWQAAANEHKRMVNAMRKLKNPGLARCWHGWLEMTATQRVARALRWQETKAMRRMLNRKLASGFNSWQVVADERRRLVHIMKKVRNPRLACGWRSWPRERRA